jgi:hypothetical protein
MLTNHAALINVKRNPILFNSAFQIFLKLLPDNAKEWIGRTYRCRQLVDMLKLDKLFNERSIICDRVYLALHKEFLKGLYNDIRKSANKYFLLYRVPDVLICDA